MKTEYTKLRTKMLGIVEGLALADDSYSELRNLISFAERVHCGIRKDYTPEFSHQLEMLALALTFHESLQNPLAVYMAVVAHDLIEDYPGFEEELESKFSTVRQYSKNLAKSPDYVMYAMGEDDTPTYHQYFDVVSRCEVCSVVKLIDRVHNLSTAPGVFSTEKIMKYCDEVDTYFYDLIRNAKTLHNQRTVYETLKFMLKTQVHTIRTLTKGS